MTDLETLAAWCRTKADDDREPAGERALWGQIAVEVAAYLFDGTVDQDGALFEATP